MNELPTRPGRCPGTNSQRHIRPDRPQGEARDRYAHELGATVRVRASAHQRRYQARSAAARLAGSRRYFVLNVVAEAQKNLLAHFGRGFALDESAFKGLETKASEHGQPILTAALGFLECEVTSRLPVGDHELIVAKVCAEDFSPTCRRWSTSARTAIAIE